MRACLSFKLQKEFPFNDVSRDFQIIEVFIPAVIPKGIFLKSGRTPKIENPNSRALNVGLRSLKSFRVDLKEFLSSIEGFSWNMENKWI